MEKRWFEAVACGKARVSLACALDLSNLLVLAIVLTAAVALHFGAEIFQSVFAEQSPVATLDTAHTQTSGNSYYRSMSESMSVAATHGGGSSSPVSYQRVMTESMAVTSFQGKAPNSYVRSMSEQASMTSGMPTSPPSASQPVRASPAPYSASSNQRIDERLSPALKMLGKRSDATKNTIGGTPYLATESFGSIDAGPPDQYSEMDELSGQDGDPDDNSALLEYLDEYMQMQQSIENAALLNVSVSAIFLTGTLAVVVTRQPIVSGGRLQNRIRAVFLLKYTVSKKAMPSTSSASTARILLFVIVVFTVPSLTVSIAPSSAQDYETNLDKSVVEILQANHLDYDRTTVLDDITKESRKQDNIWSEEVSDGQYVRVTFEQNLTSSRDITIYARTVSGEPRIQVYEKDDQEVIAEFTHLVSNESNKVYLTNLQGSRDTFDLRVLGGNVEFDYIVDPWPIPTYVGAGNPDSGTGTNVSPTLPSDLQINDILLLFVETANQAVSVSDGNGGTWTEVTDSPQGTGTSGGTSATRLTIFWSRYNGIQGNPTLSDSGNHQLGIILAFRGVITTGNPWDVTSGNVDATSDTSLSATGDTTTVANTLVVIAAALDDDADNFGATWTNSNLANIIEREDVSTGRGNDGRLGIVTGEKASVGTYSATTNTLTSSSTKAMMTIALKPPAPVAPSLSITQPDGTGDTITRGDLYNIVYTLFDPDDVTTAAFFYDTDNSGLDGTPIAGSCATAAEGFGVTCEWDTTGIAPGSYYIYGIANDGLNPAASAYSPGQITINAIVNSRGITEQAAMTDSVAIAASKSLSEQLGAGDAIARSNQVHRSMTEELGISDAMAKTVAVAMAEQMAVSEAAGRSIVASRSISEFLILTEGMSTANEKELADAIALSDTVARAIAVSGNVSEHLAVFDAISMAASKSLIEQIGLAETVARAIIMGRSVSDGLAIAEVAVISITKATLDQMAIADVLTAASSLARAMTEQFGITDVVSISVNKEMPEQLGISDDIRLTVAVARSLTEQLGISDATAKQIPVSITEQLAATDSAGRMTFLSMTLSEELSLTETLSISATKLVSEQLVMADTVTSASMLVRTMSTQLEMNESVAVFVTKTMSEELEVTDEIQRLVVINRSLVEQLSVTDSMAKAVSVTMAEQMEMTENAVRTATLARILSEQVTMTDEISKIFATTLSEEMNVADAIVRSITISRAAADELSMSDAVSKAASFALSESLTVADITDRTIEVSRAMHEQLGISDLLSVAVSKSLAEQLGVTDTVARTIEVSREMSEQLRMTDAQVKTVRNSITEQMAMTDILAADLNVSRTVDEQMGITDFISMSITQSRSEQFRVADDIERSVVVARTLTEQIGLTDVIAKQAAILMTEQMAIADTIARNAEQSATLTEQMGVSEAMSISSERSISESLSMSDTVARSVVQSASVTEQLVVADAVSIRTTKVLAEAMAMTDAVAATSTMTQTATEELDVLDTLSIAISRSLTEQIGMSDAIARSMTQSRSVSESMAIAESAIKGALVELTEQMTATDSSRSISSMSAADNLSMSESIAMRVTKEMTELIALSEAAAATISSTDLSDNAVVSDTISLAASKQASDQMAMADKIAIAVAVRVRDQLAASDSIIGATAGEIFASDQLGMEEIIAIKVSKHLADGMTLSDSVMTGGSTTMAEAFAMADALATSVVAVRAVSEGLAIVDDVSDAPAIIVAIAELMAMTESFADISASFSLNLAQTIILTQGFATDFSGVFDQADSEGIIIGDSVVLELETVGSVSESIAMHDQVSAVVEGLGRGVAESMQASDWVRMLVILPPPPPPPSVDTMPDILITETEHLEEFEGLTDPMPAEPVAGDWDISGFDEEGMKEMLDNMNMTTYDVSLEANSGDIDDLTMVLPTFWMSLKGTWADDAAFLTPVLSHMPAGAEVIVPVNIEASLDADSSNDMPGNMTVNFTTAEDSTNFAMLITVLNDNPEEDIADDPPNELPAFFIDVTVIGDFPGARPDLPGFFEEPPQLTFTVTEEWAVERNVERGPGGWPIMGLFLLDESTGDWIELTEDLSQVSAEGDTYTYTATLPHFSTYVVTAGTVTQEEPNEGSDGGELSEGGTRGQVIVNPSEPVSSSDDSGIPSEGRIVIKDIVDSLALSVAQQKPLHQRVITVHNVTVAVSLSDLQASDIGTAIATLDFEIANRNGAEEQLTLRYWYSDPTTGQTIYEDVQQVTVGANDSITRSYGVPFYSEGVFDLMIEAESDDGTLASTDIVVNVPWLAIYLYVLVAVAAIIVAVSAFYVLFAMRRRRRSDDEDELQ